MVNSLIQGRTTHAANVAKLSANYKKASFKTSVNNPNTPNEMKESKQNFAEQRRIIRAAIEKYYAKSRKDLNAAVKQATEQYNKDRKESLIANEIKKQLGKTL